MTSLDVIMLMSLCAFQSVADNATSRFCDLFDEREFAQYEYFNVSWLWHSKKTIIFTLTMVVHFQDLEKLYNTGYGNPLGPVLGVGYINELLARLTDRQVEDCTQTNSTLDGSEETFPYGKGVYADFSHDNT